MSLKVLLAAIVCLQVLRLAESHYDKEKFKPIVYTDHSNDDAIELNAQELLKRSGFSFEEHYTVADDGYITLLVRILNPKARRSQLRGPPVMLYHGPNFDQAAYLLSSSGQHLPEKWPRPFGYVPTSSNRSLGFMLANNGFDVWLVGTRASNEMNQAFTDDVEAARAEHGFTPSYDNYKLIRENKEKYWSYGLDDIIQYEIREQINTVMRVTRHPEVSIFSFSLSTPTTMAFLAQHPDYARRVRVYFQMAPAINADHFTAFAKVYFGKVCHLLPTRGNGIVPSYSVRPFLKRVILAGSKSDAVRYKLVHKYITLLFGPSQKYQANLERNLLGRIFQPVSFKSILHYCQGSRSKQLTKFDYGWEENLRRYGQQEPPAYDIGRIEVQNWVVISGSFDALADPNTVARLLETSSAPKPAWHIIAPGYNHIDLLGGVENDKYINLPVLQKLEENAIEYDKFHITPSFSAGWRSLSLESNRVGWLS